MNPHGSSLGRFGGSGRQYTIREVEETDPIQYEIVDALGHVVDGPFASLHEAEEALECLQIGPTPS